MEERVEISGFVVRIGEELSFRIPRAIAEKPGLKEKTWNLERRTLNISQI